MHDTCNCANKVALIPTLQPYPALTLTLPFLRKVATLMIELRDRKCAQHYGEDVWARADAKTKACFNFLCENHTRNLPTVRFNKVPRPAVHTQTLSLDPVPNPNTTPVPYDNFF